METRLGRLSEIDLIDPAGVVGIDSFVTAEPKNFDFRVMDEGGEHGSTAGKLLCWSLLSAK